MSEEANWPVQYVEEEIEGGEEKKHPLVNNPSSLLGVLLLLGRVVLLLREPDQGELHSVDKNCTEDEEEVDKNPKGESCKALGHLERGLSSNRTGFVQSSSGRA